MKRAALGVRMHSGWGVLVAVSGDPHSPEVIDRRRIVTTDSANPGDNQPYHYAASLALPDAEQYLANRATVCDRLAFTVIEEVFRELDARRYRVVAAAVLLASGRPLPSLSKILASHPLIHTAEGEFFRHAVSEACERLKIPVTAIRERELEEQAKSTLGKASSQVQRRIASLGTSVGPPWTKDHKTAALAASIILARTLAPK
jgi:hypothetical protein